MPEADEKADPGRRSIRLSPRELGVWRLISKGLTPREIAAELRLSPRTVECYRDQLRLKLGLPTHCPVRLALLGLECGLAEIRPRKALAGIHRLEVWEQLARVNAEIFGGGRTS